MRSVSGVGRAAAVCAVVAAIALAGFLLFGGGSGGYEVTAKFVNAGQLVKGNPVQSGGSPIGTITAIRISPDGQAEVKMKIKSQYAPLRQGVRAQIKQFSLSGIANRYIDLQMPPNGAEKIADGGVIGVDRTTTAVDLDQLFDTLDPPTRKALQGFFQGNARQFRGRGDDANVAFQYLNPALATSSRLFNELTRDQPTLERFLVDSSHLVSTLAQRRDDLSGLIGNLGTTTQALANQKAALAESIQRLPPFLRRANTTFVNLRASLNDVDPLVSAAEPVAKRLDPFLTQARGFAADAKPTIADLRVAISRKGSQNDLIDFIKSVPPLTDIAVDSAQRNGKERRGALPESVDALRDSSPLVAQSRPYTTDFLGWLDDFSTTGAGFDALGAYARAHITLGENLGGPLKRDQFKRCPGASEEAATDGSNVLSGDEQKQLDCSESDRATGPVN